jgi:hypothetical protein
MTQSSLKKQNGKYQLNTLQKSTFWFSPQFTYPYGIAQCKKLAMDISRLGTLNSYKLTTNLGAGFLGMVFN